MKNLELLPVRKNHFPAWNTGMRNKNAVFHTFGNLYEISGL